MSGPEPGRIRSVAGPKRTLPREAPARPLPPDALALLTAWLPQDDDPDRPVMQLATVDADGAPDVRTVLLSAWSEAGFVFHTDARSRKVQQLTADVRVALVVLHPSGSRQLVARGRAVPAPAEADALAFERRTESQRRLAWLNTLEMAQLPPEQRAAEWAAFAEAHGSDVPPPETWSGRLVQPDRLTFWQADPAGPSHRVEYRLGSSAEAAGGWSMHHLAG
ncbi:pyridoxamine 5'-phosphate oxidase family protein [uncultured Amnibacterium sp.]|uniref:pyridoxamine 5'-phosphate oxidase family protein n=1 Tax=uncultured Amnibacterium sp. TaxID=1631851 RepID=UPI0035CC0749